MAWFNKLWFLFLWEVWVWKGAGVHISRGSRRRAHRKSGFPCCGKQNVYFFPQLFCFSYPAVSFWKFELLLKYLESSIFYQNFVWWPLHIRGIWATQSPWNCFLVLCQTLRISWVPEFLERRWWSNEKTREQKNFFLGFRFQTGFYQFCEDASFCELKEPELTGRVSQTRTAVFPWDFS